MLDARTRRRWEPRDTPADTLTQTAAISAIAHELGLAPLAARLLVLRGVPDAECARRFLKPRLSDLTEPTLIPGVTRAAERVAQAVRDGQPIVIYGDYDVDGVTASATLWHVLRACGARVTTYVPHRIDEGYGLNEEAIGKLAGAERVADGEWRIADGAEKPLIVSVDCGITACGPAKVAKDLGVDLIITDHHHFDPALLPEAHTLVHPALPCDEGESAAGTCRDLCGAGVAFKLAWQVARACCGSERVSEPMKELLLDLLSLVALGTVADVVPLAGENRVLTIFGLSRVKRTRFVGLNALIDASRLRDEKVSSYHVGFVLGPRLNACGRMGHAARAVHLLTEANADEARETAEFLTGENDKRRAIERAIFEEAKQMVLDAGDDSDDRRAIVVGKEGWHSGVVGIVASRLVEAFGRPAVVLSIDDGDAHGSARSVEGVSIHEAIGACSEHLERFGGHAMAAGVGLRTDAIDAFREALVAAVNERLDVEDLVSVRRYDAEVTLADCEVGLFAQIERLEPFGRGNLAPLLLLRGVTLDRAADRMGQTGRHLSMLLRQGGRMMRAVAFNLGDLAEQLPGGVAIDVLFEPKASVWQGQKRAELHVRDLRRAGDE